MIFSIAMGAEYLSYVKSIATFAPTFYGYIISVSASVSTDANTMHCAKNYWVIPSTCTCTYRLIHWLSTNFDLLAGRLNGLKREKSAKNFPILEF